MNEHDDPLPSTAENTVPLLDSSAKRGEPLPAHVGRYRVERLLGKGGFGRVYLAHDDQLQRRVAVKVPHPGRITTPEDAAVYLAEARAVAALDHPNIVPVFDVGSTPEFPFFLVSKLIEGRTLASAIAADRPGPVRAAELVAAVAEALHHAHLRGVVHRDVKPGNILLDAAGQPHVVDFGVALREQDAGRERRYVGTPDYMSPEQAGGEGHRVDGRSDVFSLGVVFHELLTGRRPFRADGRAERRTEITTWELQPERLRQDAVPQELGRICLKALARRASDRYQTAKELADDVRQFLAVTAGEAGPSPPPPSPEKPSAGQPATPTDSAPVRVVPKGLRPFDACDADFFLDLLPGPRDREGLPESLRFWKARVEERCPEQTFPVGLVYGPSGCGKSSLLRAGLLPRLASHVLPVYVEATGGETEARLLNALRKRWPSLDDGQGLKEALAALRRGRGIPAGSKVLLVLDQFEQWLHARSLTPPPSPSGERGRGEEELVQALRQCDGGRLQCLLLIRDDFWMAVTRFLAALEVELQQGRNASAVDLFPPRHAVKVLAAFGRALGALPEKPGQTTREQQQFLEQAVAGLAEDGKVICVRLALFAEMMRARPWTPAALREVGGTAGVGVTFLEEAFSSAAANPQHRLHQTAARAVLAALLPRSGTDIKGAMQPEHALREASGYAGHPRDYEALMRLLDAELRLITPTDAEGMAEVRGGKGGREAAVHPAPPSVRYYQLTHDYLVRPLREWLTRKQKETWRGRAELWLADRAELWKGGREDRLLPAWWEWLSIRLLTRKRDWTPPEQRMMRRAGRRLASRGLLLAAVLALAAWAGWEMFGRVQAGGLRNRLLEATTADVPGVVTAMRPYRRWLDADLRQAFADAREAGDRRKQLHASLALLPVDDGQLEYLLGRLLSASPEEVVATRTVLEPKAAAVCGRLWQVLEDRHADPGRRLRAACCLAAYAPDDDRWDKVSGAVAARLVRENALLLKEWAAALRPVSRALLSALAGLVAEGGGASDPRILAGLYAEFAAHDPAGFAPLEQLLPEAGNGLRAVPAGPESAQAAHARRQATVAAALAAAGRWDKVWPLLRHSQDPTLRSYLVERLGTGGAEARTLIERLDPTREPDVSVRRALLLALADFGEERLPAGERDLLVPRVLRLYRHDPDPGIHGAAGWLLRRWGQQAEAEQIDRELATGEVQGERRWYVNRQRQTMVVVPAGEIETKDQAGRPRTLRVERPFALGAREVTVAEFRRFRKEHQVETRSAPCEECPVNEVSWYDAAAYCNWLSKQEGLPETQWCYAPNRKGEYGEGMRVKAGGQHLEGYRLPSEAEWEYACRAGSETPWSMGQGVDVLGRYAWSMLNSGMRSRPVGLLRPNDLGLFDMHGNVWEWTQDRCDGRGVSGTGGPEKEDLVDRTSFRLLRGGTYLNDPEVLRAANRNWNRPATRTGADGFRVGRAHR